MRLCVEFGPTVQYILFDAAQRCAHWRYFLYEYEYIQQQEEDEILTLFYMDILNSFKYFH